MSTVYKRSTDPDENLVMSIHDFCAFKQMPPEIEDLFYNYFRTYFDANLKSDDTQIFTYLVGHMKFGDILIYFNMFVKQLRNS